MSAYIILEGKDGNFYKRITVGELAKIKGLPWRCGKCGRTKKLTIDHKLPRAKKPKTKNLLTNF